MRRRVLGVAVALAVSAAAVFAAVAVSAKAPERGYVTSAMVIPSTNTEARSIGRDMDHDGEADNQLGQVFAALATQGMDFQGAQTASITAGDLLMLHSLRTPSFRKAKRATWQVLYAEPTATPDFSGSGSFTVSDDPPSPKLRAKVKKGHVTTSVGNIPVELATGGGIITLELTNAKVAAKCSKSGCSGGRITGALTTDELETSLAPQFGVQFTAIVTRDCPGPDKTSCAADSSGKTLQSLFDSNDDLTISAEEILTSPLFQALFTPDLDLEKANGQPGQDGVADALSAGFGFTAVKGRFVR